VHTVEVEAGPDREITCQVCGGPLAGREGKFMLKYYLCAKAFDPNYKARHPGPDQVSTQLDRDFF
jgi:hypothetical protein